MIHRVKKAFSTLLVLYEIMVCSKAAESIQAVIPTVTGQLAPTLNSEVTTISLAELEPKHPAPTANLSRHETKIELGATTANITRHHNFGHLNRTKPHFHLSSSRFGGPFFEEGSEMTNVTARVGSAINLECRIGLLGDKTVTWTQKRNQNINLLTVGKSTHSKDERIQLAFRYPNNYRLQISYVTKRDDGMYECQVATHPPKVKRIYLKITAPEVKIVDESGREVHERYYRQGSSLLLTCVATSIGFSEKEEPDKNIISWKHGVRLLSKGSSFSFITNVEIASFGPIRLKSSYTFYNVMLLTLNITKETDSAVSVLTITPLEKSHSGNYTCSVGNLAESTVAVHVLNGELPAAVQTAGVHFKSSNSPLLVAILTLFSLLR